MNGPHATVQLLQRIPIEGLLAAYPNAGYPKYTDGRFIYHAAPDYFAQAARQMVAEGARLIGGCCGTNPRTIAAISNAVAGLKPVKSKPVRVITSVPPPPEKKVSATPEESLLDKIAAGKRVIICELDPPKTLAPRSLYVMADEIRWAWQHSIPPAKALRYSMTFRTRADAATKPRAQHRSTHSPVT